MRLESEIFDRGNFHFITSSDRNDEKENISFKGDVRIINGGKVEIVLKVDKDAISFISGYSGLRFSLSAELYNSKFSLFIGCFVVSMPLFQNGEVKISVGMSFLDISSNIIKQILANLEKKDFPDIKGIRFSFDNIENWIHDNTSFDVSLPCENDNKLLIVTYSPREPIILYENNMVEIRMVFSCPVPKIPIIQSVTLSESAFIEIRNIGNNLIEKDNYFDYFYRTITLMYLLIGVPVSAKKMEAIFESATDKSLSYSKFFFQSTPFLEKGIHVSYDEINIPFQSLVNLNKQFIVNWYENFDKFLPSINLYVSSKIVSNNNIENKFLWLAQAAEALHRRTSRHDGNRKIIFRNRLRELLLPIWEILQQNCCTDDLVEERYEQEKMKKGSEYCIDEIVRFRNMLTHNGLDFKRLDFSAAKVLITLSSILELTLIFNLLKQCDLSNEKIIALINKRYTGWFNLRTKIQSYISEFINLNSG